MTSSARLLPVIMALGMIVADTGVQGQDADRTAALVDRASRYVQDYERQFSAVVCEERQVQQLIKGDGTTRRRRELVSDVLMVKLRDRTLTFRDVISADAKPVRDRAERLQKLFLDSPRSALQQARAIAGESARYNIGFRRDMDTLMLPLAILNPRWVSGFRFAPTEQGLMFDETRTPSLMRFNQNGTEHDMVLHGRFALDPGTGRLLSASLTADNPAFETSVDVRYAEDPIIGLLMPAEMQERYRQPAKPKEDHLDVSSSYSTFRRFQVTTDERIGTAR